MRRLVGEEGDLGEQDAEGSGDEQLEPAVTEQDEAGDRSAEAERERADDDDVESAGAPSSPVSRTTCESFVYAWAMGGKLSLRAYVWRTAPRVDTGAETVVIATPACRGMQRGRDGRKRKADADRCCPDYGVAHARLGNVITV